MEGKSSLSKYLGGVDAISLALGTTDASLRRSGLS
jgi:malic enzyme